MAAGISEPRVRQHARRRCVLGRTAGGAILGRSHSRNRREGAVHGTRRRGTYCDDADQTSGQSAAYVAHGSQPARGATVERRWRPHLPQRSRGGARLVTARTLCVRMVALRQHRGHYGGRRRGNDHHGSAGNCPTGGPERRPIRVCRGKNEPPGPPRVGGCGYVYVQAGAKRVATSGNRPDGPTLRPLTSDPKPTKRAYTRNPPRAGLPFALASTSGI